MGLNIQKRMEELILIIIVILNILVIFNMLSPDFLYIKNIISWAAMGYLFYIVSPTWIFFGNKHKHIDLLIIFSYYALIFKNFLSSVVAIGVEENLLIGELYQFFVTNVALIDIYGTRLGLRIGIIGLLLLAIYITWRLEFRKPSLLDVIHEIGPAPRTIGKFLERFIIVLLVLMGFFVIVFNIFTEWLGQLIDAPLVMIGIIFYILLMYRKHHFFNPEKLIYKIGQFGESFLEKFIKLFHNKATIYLGFTGILVLHVVSDTWLYIRGYLFGGLEELYFSVLERITEKAHEPIIHLLQQDLGLVAGFSKMSVFLVYFFNVVALIFLLLMPVLIWYMLFKRTELKINKSLLFIIFSSLLTYAALPLFRMTSIRSNEIVGTDVQTHGIIDYPFFISQFFPTQEFALHAVIFLALLIGIILAFAGITSRLRKDEFIIAVIIGLIFFGFYVYYFYSSFFVYYTNTIGLLFRANDFFLMISFIIFFIFSSALYLIGYPLFVFEIWKRHFASEIEG